MSEGMEHFDIQFFASNTKTNTTAGYINDEPAIWPGLTIEPSEIDAVTFLDERDSFEDERGFVYYVHDSEFGTGIKSTKVDVKILESEDQIKTLAPGDCFRVGHNNFNLPDRFVGVAPDGDTWIMKAHRYTEGIFQNMTKRLAALWKAVTKKIKLKIIPITLKAAKEFVSALHRHHQAPQGHKFSIGVQDHDGQLRGVVIVGRPVARHLDDGLTAEATRVCTDGTFNACSMLYAAAWKAARAMGYERMITYTLREESGASLKASNFTPVSITKGQSWSRDLRKRTDKHPTVDKVRWQIGAACEPIAL